MKEPILVKLKMKASYKTILYFLGLLIIIISAIGLLYLFYDKVSGNDGDVEVNGVLSINYIDGKNFSITDSKDITFSVSNESDNISYYNISFNNIKGEGKYTLKYNDTSLLEGDLNSSDKITTDYISLDAKETKTYILTISSNELIEGKITIESGNGTVVTFADTILKNNPPVKETITKVGSEIATKNEGLIKSNDDTGISYYFRGDVQNNYVNFGNMLWRIVRINGDGTVRLILNNTASSLAAYYTSIDEVEFKNSTMYTYLNSWLQENLKDDLKYIANSKFCSDFTKDDLNNYLLYTRIMVNKIPTLNCLGTIFSSNIGLITIDEVVLAGAAPTINNESFYLYNNAISDPWYTMSPAVGSSESLNMFMVGNTGNIRTDVNGNLFRKIRPVINIIKNVEVNGNGTLNDPYTIIK